jgi:hypothetical protein
MSNKNKRKLKQFENEYHATDEYLPWFEHDPEVKLAMMTEMRADYDKLASVDQKALERLFSRVSLAVRADARYDDFD